MANYDEEKMRTRSIVILLLLFSATATDAAPPTKPERGKGRKQQITTINLHDMEVGQSGFLTFGYGKGVNTLLPLRVGDVEEGQLLAINGAGKPLLIVRGIKTEGLVTDRYFQLDGAVKVTATEQVSTGETVFVVEPVDPEKFTLRRSNSPTLEMPR